MLATLIDLALHLDRHLLELVADYGVWVYAILFLIIFSETGFVVTPFLPGDSLLFVAGALCAAGKLDVVALIATLVSAAVLGNQLNFFLGRWFGRIVAKRMLGKVAGKGGGQGVGRWLRQDYLDRTNAFFARHGGKTIVLSRFVPIVRTYAPFVAGLGAMRLPAFALFNVFGGALWVVSLVGVGYFFGNLPFVKQNLTLVLLGIVVLSIMPAVFEQWRVSRETTAP